MSPDTDAKTLLQLHRVSVRDFEAWLVLGLGTVKGVGLDLLQGSGQPNSHMAWFGLCTGLGTAFKAGE